MKTPASLAALRALLDAPQGRRIGVLGLGISGRAMAVYLVHRGAVVIAADQNPAAPVDNLRGLGMTLRLGAFVLNDVEALAISPGVDPRQPVVQAALRQGIPVFGELELAGVLPARVVGITGTNGKSTTTALCGALVQGLGQRTFVGGNLGEPVVGWLDQHVPTDVAVLELSSYQLETAYSFAPAVGVVLNVTPDHLERYATAADYAAAKEHLVACVPPDGCVVLNADDPQVRLMARSARGRVLWFSSRSSVLPGDGAYLAGHTLVPVGLGSLGRLDLQHPRLWGRHNLENSLAAVLAVYSLGLCEQATALLPAYLAFPGLPHRLEWAGEIGKVTFINDSKATNDASAATGLKAMQGPVLLLAGGKDKGCGYGELVQAAQSRNVRRVLAFGAAGDAVAAAFAATEIFVQRVAGLIDACVQARAHALPGDVVLLSPACSSFDEFRDYQHRGDVFKAWVKGQT